MRKIQFTYQHPFPQFRNRSSLKRFIPTICKTEKYSLDHIIFVFCSDSYLLEINKQFLQHDTLTDIISFNYAPPGQPIQGEIYISSERVIDNARLLNLPLQEEIVRVVFHGVLHFCGYKDKLKADQALMRAKEDFYLRRYLSA
jgi:rRNA maturation RNase YbeY